MTEVTAAAVVVVVVVTVLVVDVVVSAEGLGQLPAGRPSTAAAAVPRRS